MAADPVTKSEDANVNLNGNGNANVVDHAAYPPPPGPSEKPAAGKLTSAQEAMHKKVLEHFRSESYEMPGVQDDGRLMDEEKFWLVRGDLFDIRRVFFDGFYVVQ